MISKGDLEYCLDKGMSRDEIAFHFGCCSKTVSQAYRYYGAQAANARRDEGVRLRVIREYEATKLPYKLIAKRCRTNMKVVSDALSNHNKLIRAGGAVAPVLDESLSWGDFTYMGKRVTLIERDRYFATIILNGDRTVVEAGLLKEVA